MASRMTRLVSAFWHSLALVRKLQMVDFDNACLFGKRTL